jgi:hypothetical protein
MSARASARLAWSMCALTLVFVGCVIVSIVLHGSHKQSAIFLVAVISSCALVGAVVASRRPRNPVGWFFVVSAACSAIAEATLRYAIYGLVIVPGSLPLAHAMAWPSTWMWVPGIMLVLLFVPLYFPNGHLLSPRWRSVLWLALFVSVTLAALWAFVPGGEGSNGVPGITNPLGIEVLRPVAGTLGSVVTGVLFLPVFLASVASLVVRFRRSRGEERQQMKWITYAAATLFVMIPLGMSLANSTNQTLLLIFDSLIALVFAGIPVAVGIALLRYRLYDIDVVINRTLVYGSLTATLALVYVGSVVGSQYVFRALTGQGSTLAVVASTLAIAALFSPLRRLVQALVDRRFYRRKYDAAKTLEAFGARLREETDLDALRDDVVRVARMTMQPAHVSLWLRPNPEPEAKSAALRQFGHEEE